MCVVIRVASRTSQWAFACDLYRKRGLFTIEDLAPCLNNLRGLHGDDSLSDRTQSVRSASALLGSKPRGRDGGAPILLQSNIGRLSTSWAGEFDWPGNNTLISSFDPFATT